MAWREEVEKKPSSMTATDALKILGLGPQNLEDDEGVIRKAYFKMAQKVIKKILKFVCIKKIVTFVVILSDSI